MHIAPYFYISLLGNINPLLVADGVTTNSFSFMAPSDIKMLRLEERTFNTENYYLPIPSIEIDKVGLTQNTGY